MRNAKDLMLQVADMQLKKLQDHAIVMILIKWNYIDIININILS